MQALIDYVQFAFTCTVTQVSININTLQIKAVLGEKDDQPTIKVSSLFNINDCIIFFLRATRADHLTRVKTVNFKNADDCSTRDTH